MNISNKIKSHFYLQYKKSEIKDHNLLYIFLELSRKCNLNCLHCGSDCVAQNNTPELTTDSWLKIIDYFDKHYSKQTSFIITGGEPLMYKNLDIVCNHIKSKNRRWSMVTNGMLLDKTKMQTLESNGLYSLTISVDGLEKNHNKLRNNHKAFEKLKIALKAVSESKIKYKDAVTCVFPDNLSELNEIADFLLQNKINSWRLFRIFPSGRAENNPDLQLTFEQTHQMINWIKDNKKKYKNKGLTINLSCEGWLPFDIDSQVRDTNFFCRAGVNIASVLCDGTITGCTNNHDSFYTGNILNDDFNTVWENNFDNFRKTERLKNTICNNCEHLKYCRGSSIHLWNLNHDKLKFCYAVNLHEK